MAVKKNPKKLTEKNLKTFFTARLMHWHQVDNKRTMPWKGERDPYRIWISEIILQQTRVEQGWEYYNRLIRQYPTIKALAQAPAEEIYKLWEGLGYYSRCRNLIRTAALLNEKYKGKFPDDYDSILALPGIGPYTAAAIASFAFGLPHAVVDGNVFRVLSRYFGMNIPIDRPEGKRVFGSLANELLDQDHPGKYNQAIMDLGAVVCKPRQPLCSSCPLQKKCIAFRDETVDRLPVKGMKPSKQERWFYYLLIKHKGKVFLRQRTGKDIWHNLHEFVLFDTGRQLPEKNLKNLSFTGDLLKGREYEIGYISEELSQQLTHQTIRARVIGIKLKENMPIHGYKATGPAELQRLAFPKILASYLKSMSGK